MIRTNLAGELAAHLMLALWSELDRHQFGGSLAHAVTDVVAMDDEGVAAIVGAAHDQMDVRIIGVPVINSDPIQPRSERHPQDLSDRATYKTVYRRRKGERIQ